MIKNPDILEKFERELIKKENLSFKQALAIFEAMWKEGVSSISCKRARESNGRGAFRRFKDVLLSYLEKREEWFKFQNERLEKRVMEWLEENEIELA